MVRKIIWSPEAIESYISILEYIEREWTGREVRNFMVRVSEKLDILKRQPLLGRVSGKRKKTFRTLISKQTTLIYLYKPRKQEIELVTFWSNARNPKDLKQ